jgi:hypothetical protein
LHHHYQQKEDTTETSGEIAFLAASWKRLLRLGFFFARISSLCGSGGELLLLLGPKEGALFDLRVL